VPHGGSLIHNVVSKAPGFRMENVFVMAGVPKVMNAMMEEIAPDLTRGSPVHSHTIRFEGGEGDIAKGLKEVQERYPSLALGSYPFETPLGFATNLVLRGRDQTMLAAAVEDVKSAVDALFKSGKARGWSEVP
jgi:molybdopterin-biosynthesis enzyme MoeA-like protein